MHAGDPGRLALLLTGSAAFAMMGAGISLFGPSILSFERLHGLTTAEASLFVSANWVGSLSGVITMFLRPGSVGPRPALACLALGAMGIGAGLGWTLTLLSAVVFGFGYGLLTAVFNPRILAAYGSRGPAMLSLINAVFSLGAILAPLCVVFYPDRADRLFVLVGAVTALVFLFAGPAARVEATVAGAGSGFRLHPPILVLGFLGIGLEVCLVGLGPSALVRSGIGEAEAARLLSAFYLTFLLGRVVLIFVAHRLPDFSIYLGGMAVTAVLALGAAVIDPGLFFAPMGLAAGLFFPGYYVTGSRLIGGDARVSPALIIVAQFGAMLMPPALALIVAPMGGAGFFWIIAGLAGTTTVASAFLYPGMMRKT